MRRLRFWKEVFRSAFAVAGLVAGLVTVAVGGSVLAAGSFLLHERHRVWAIIVFAGGVLGAVLEGSYRVWNATEIQLQVARARLRELDTDEAKRAYLDEQIARAEGFQRRIEAVPEDEWLLRARTYDADVAHWENEVRADLREAFAGDLDILFDSDEGFGPGPSGVVLGSREYKVHYLDRRITRLRQIKDQL